MVVKIALETGWKKSSAIQNSVQVGLVWRFWLLQACNQFHMTEEIIARRGTYSWTRKGHTLFSDDGITTGSNKIGNVNPYHRWIENLRKRGQNETVILLNYWFIKGPGWELQKLTNGQMSLIDVFGKFQNSDRLTIHRLCKLKNKPHFFYLRNPLRLLDDNERTGCY